MIAERNDNKAGPSIGTGFYTIPEAARILRLPPRRLRRWATGYRSTSRGVSYAGQPVIARGLSGEKNTTLSFLDVIELLFVDLFRRQNVSMPTIRAAAENARSLFHTDHPFAVRRFDTDGKRIFATLSADDVTEVSSKVLYEDLAAGQFVLEYAARPYFKNIEYDHDEALRYWPMGREAGVVVDARRALGRPILSGSGTPTHPLYQMAVAGESVTNIARWYELEDAAVRAAIEYESLANVA